MRTEEDISQQRNLLDTHRQTLFILLQQRAKHSSTNTPPAVEHGITEARKEIRSIKSTLRSWDAEVRDHPNDEEPRESELLDADATEERLFDCGHRLREIREEIDLTVSEFIELIGYNSEKGYTQIEIRQSECPLSVISSVSEATGVSIEWLKHNKPTKHPVLFAPIYWTPQFLHYTENELPKVVYFCIELRYYRILVLVQLSTYIWKIFRTGTSLDFWNWIDDLQYIPKIYDSICAIQHRPYEVHSRIFDQDLFTHLEEGEIHPYRATDLFHSRVTHWSEDIIDIGQAERTLNKYRKEYGEWFIRVQDYFRKYKNFGGA